MNTIALLYPDLALIAFGFALRRWAGWETAFWSGLERMVYFVLFPALLFNSILRTPLTLGSAAPAVSITLAAVLLGIVLSYAARRALRAPAKQFASGAQCGFRFNSYVALALSQRIGGEPGLALCAVIVGFVVPLANVGAVYPLARHAGTGFVRELVRNPLIIATVSGMIGNIIGLELPQVVAATVTRLGSAALALGLLAVGAGLSFSDSFEPDQSIRRGTRQLTAWFTAVKLLAMPAFALLLVTVLELDTAAAQIVVMFTAMPTASSAYILATRMGGDGPFVAFLISVSMVASLVTLPLWLSLVH